MALKGDSLRADKFRLKVQLSVLEKHGGNFAKVLSQFTNDSVQADPDDDRRAKSSVSRFSL